VVVIFKFFEKKGMRGLIELKILEYIQKHCNLKNIFDSFDLLSGTSTGGIISLGNNFLI
jgi:patatin-like phospholipase/acyl hydrolase